MKLWIKSGMKPEHIDTCGYNENAHEWKLDGRKQNVHSIGVKLAHAYPLENVNSREQIHGYVDMLGYINNLDGAIKYYMDATSNITDERYINNCLTNVELLENIKYFLEEHTIEVAKNETYELREATRQKIVELNEKLEELRHSFVLDGQKCDVDYVSERLEKEYPTEDDVDKHSYRYVLSYFGEDLEYRKKYMIHYHDVEGEKAIENLIDFMKNHTLERDPEYFETKEELYELERTYYSFK